MKIIRFLCAVTILFTVVLGGALFAQTAAKPAFEVATIKPAPSLMDLMAEIQSGKRNLGALQTNIDGARADFGYVPLSNMILYAYKLKQYQITGGPDWLSSQAFEIHAKIPEGGTKEQVPEMMQSLLVERFKLVSHRESKEQPVYALIVSKDGPKLKEAAADPVPPSAAEDAAKTPPAKDGSSKGEILSLKTAEGDVKIKQEGNGMVMSGGKTGQIRMNMGTNGAMSMEIAKITMTDFCELLNQLVDRPVMDMTDLKGTYQIALEIPIEELMNIVKRIAPKMGIPLPAGLGSSGIAGAAPGAGGLSASDPSGSSISQAVQKLGLKLDSRKMPVETLVVDQIEKTPTED
jgi:uncharacterized protein (TIGR03435 family)